MLVILYRATTRFTAVNPQKKKREEKISKVLISSRKHSTEIVKRAGLSK